MTISNQPPIAALCRWLKLLDGWATFYELDPSAEQQPAREPLSARDRAQALYLLKERAMKTLYASGSPAVSVGVLEGPATAARVWLCEKCLVKAAKSGMSPRDYAEQTGGCADCQSDGREPDYFSLYVIQVDYGPLGRWQFHTPVPLGRQYLPAPRSETAPVLGKRPLDREGRMLRLGASINQDERREYPEAEVIFQVWRGIKSVEDGV